GAAGGDDDDGRADALVSRLFDHPPAVEARKHEIEDADVRSLEPKALDPRLTVGDGDGVEAGALQMAGHPARDDVVVLDDQDLGHDLSVNGPRRTGGRQLVSE